MRVTIKESLSFLSLHLAISGMMSVANECIHQSLGILGVAVLETHGERRWMAERSMHFVVGVLYRVYALGARATIHTAALSSLYAAFLLLRLHPLCCLSLDASRDWAERWLLLTGHSFACYSIGSSTVLLPFD